MEADAPPLLPHVEKDAPPLFGDVFHGQANLVAAVAAKTAKDIAGKALAMNPDQGRFPGVHIPHHQGDMFIRVDITPVDNSSKLTISGRQLGFGHPVHQFFVAAAVGDEVGHRDYLDAELIGDYLKLGQPRHGAVFVHNLADNAGGIEPGQPG
ncbi:hypothetical protein ES708_25877 [subsurface metagenome]